MQGKGWSLRLRCGAKARAFAYGAGQRLEPSLTVRGKGWSLRLRCGAKAGAFAYGAGKGWSLRLQFFSVAGARFAVFDVS